MTPKNQKLALKIGPVLAKHPAYRQSWLLACFQSCEARPRHKMVELGQALHVCYTQAMEKKENSEENYRPEDWASVLAIAVEVGKALLDDDSTELVESLRALGLSDALDEGANIKALKKQCQTHAQVTPIRRSG